MNTWIKKAGLALLLSASSTCLFAGTLAKVPVEINMETLTAGGSMTSARFSSNEFEMIGCGVRTFRTDEGYQLDFGFCSASLVEGETVMCTTENMDLIETIRAIDDFSYVIFRWNEDGECQYVGNSTRSQYITGKLK